MEIIDNNIDELILAYLNQELKGEDYGQLETWVLASENNRAYFRKTCEVWLASGMERIKDRFNALEAFELFKANHYGELTGESAKAGKAKRSLGRVALRWATAAAVFALVAALSFIYGGKTVEQALGDVTVEAPLGSCSCLRLPDGTVIHLNAGSRITYSQKFGVSERNVSLSGECWFDVAKNEDIPFCVSTEDLSVKVLGTQFNFKDYPEDLEAIVTLKKGRVALSNKLQNETEKYLNPNQRVILDKHNGEMRIESKDASNADLWTSGNLFFDEELLSDIAKELERHYNVRITMIGEKIRSMRVYGNFSTKEMSLTDILDNLTATNRVSYSISDGVVTLRATNELR